MSNEIDLGALTPPLTEAEEAADKIADSVRDLTLQSWDAMKTVNDGRAKYTINISVTVRPEGEGWKLETRLSNKPPAIEDEREGYVHRHE